MSIYLGNTLVADVSKSSLPSQSGHSGQFLTTNGTSASWASVPSNLPSQSGNSGKFLTTNGTSASWATVSTGSSVPAGCVEAYAGSGSPTGYLLCNGSAVSRTTYASLYAAIGTTYGSGNGSTTFNVPDLRAYFIMGGSSSGTKVSAGLPNITGTFSGVGQALHSSPNPATLTGAFYREPTKDNPAEGVTLGNSGERDDYFGFSANLSNSIYGNSDTVQPPSIIMKYYIKY